MSLISIIIPVHNTATYLRKCIESVRNQSLKDIEIILVENLSQDESAAICNEYACLDSRIKVVHLSVAGPSVARNAGLEMSSSPYIGFIDSDDYIEPSMYEDMLNALICNRAEMAYCNLYYEYENQATKKSSSNLGRTYVYSSREVLREIICDKISSSVCTKLFKKEIFNTLHFPEGFFFEDHATLYKWVALCDKIVWVDNSYYHYLQRQDSICHSMNLIKRYHYFLAEYSRLEFARQVSLFEGKELFDITTLIVKNCLWHFREAVKLGDHTCLAPIRDMRCKLRCLLSLTKRELDYKYYKRLRKISYFWPIYYFIHSRFKRRD